MSDDIIILADEKDEFEDSEVGKPPPSRLRVACDLYQQFQRNRIQMRNRESACERGSDSDKESKEYFTYWKDKLAELENETASDVAKLVKRHPAWPWLVQVKGCGPTLSGRMLALIGDISTFGTVSKLWRFAGEGMGEYWCDGEKVLCPKEGNVWKKNADGVKERDRVVPKPPDGAVLRVVRDRQIAGYCSVYSTRLKTTLYLQAASFIKCNSPYRTIYDQSKAFYTSTKPEWTKNHCHLAAMRKMAKIFLSHVWETWRKAEGLPTREVYVVEKLGHTHVFRPEDFTKPING